LQEVGAELIVLAGYLKILPAEIIKHYKERIINIHPSLLPSFGGNGMYGLNVHRAVLDYGCKVSGATVHFVDEGVDTGKIIAQKAVDILEKDTPETLQKRIMEEAEQVILPKAVKMLSEKIFSDYKIKTGTVLTGTEIHRFDFDADKKEFR
jgi:phosphoribosylglycinamide formyltransferase-1